MICAGASIGVLVAGGETASGMYFIHGRSPYYTVPSLEKAAKKLTARVETIDNATVTQRDVICQITSSIKAIMDEQRDQRNAAHEQAMNAVDMACLSSDLHPEIMALARAINEVADNYHK